MARFSVKRSTKTRIRALLAAAVAVLMAMLAVPAPAQAYDPPAVSPFSDVPTSHPHYTEIAWMWEQGISTGWPDGTYRPSQQVDRDAMAAFFYRYQGEPAYTAPPSSPFTDIWPSIMFYKEMSWMEATGISTGWPDGTYRRGHHPAGRNVRVHLPRRRRTRLHPAGHLTIPRHHPRPPSSTRR